MTLKEIANKISEPGVNNIWEIDINGQKATLKKFGFRMFWKKFSLEKEGKEFYRIVRGDNLVVTSEFFNNKHLRNYSDNQANFIDYIKIVDNIKKLPPWEELLSKRFNSQYIEAYELAIKEIFNFQ